MKKIIALVLALLMLPITATAEKTARRGLVEFIELYTSRFTAYAKENDLEFDVSPLSALPPWKSGDLLMFETSAGTAGVYPGGYDLHDLVMTFYSLSDNDADNELYATSCVIAISALEYDALYETGPSFKRKSAIEDATTIFEKIGNGLEETLTQAIETESRVLVYTGNYDYYVEYVTIDNREFVHLIAEEHQKKNETHESGDSETDVYLVSLEEFVYYFNFYGSSMGDGHKLSIEKAFDFEKAGDKILFKTIFNDCEILTLMLSADATEVKNIYCTWASNMQGASDYLNDFLQMLMETLLACGMESDSISSLFTDFGEVSSFNVGDKGEITIDGIKISYEVTSYSGVSFKIERE